MFSLGDNFLLNKAALSYGVLNGGKVDVFEAFESNVRYYCHVFPTVFTRGSNATVESENGTRYIDFFCAAGSLNYGHNNPRIKRAIIDYLENDGIVQALDMYTVPKRQFIEIFNSNVLGPRKLDYKIQFCGPTGTNSVEAALKLARTVTGRQNVLAFMGAYHGLSLGSLSVTGNLWLRGQAGFPSHGCTFVPFEDGPSGHFESIAYLEKMFRDPFAGVQLPAAIIVEPVQAEGGVYVATERWLQSLAQLCNAHGIILICDEIQTGCGRTGDFFAFERSGIQPDMVCVSKSIGGLGLPMSLLLIRRELDKWPSGADAGTFRGNQLGFIGGATALSYWQGHEFQSELSTKAEFAASRLRKCSKTHANIAVRGRGLIWGLDFSYYGSRAARDVSAEAFKQELLVECAGRNGSVLKIMPPLTIDMSDLEEGFNRLDRAVYKWRSSA